MVQIDGSKGEGGGQVLRSALSLSAWLGVPFRITNIRAKRSKPGLRAQHVAAVRMVAQICDAETEGVKLGSRKLTFSPGAVRTGTFLEEVGTAGATTLVAQAAAPALLRAPGSSLLKIRGGTHVSWAPPLDYLQEVYAPLLELLGLELRPRLLRAGFYPRGGGQIGVEVTGRVDESASSRHAGRTGKITLERPPRSKIRVDATAVVSALPRNIADRMLKTVGDRLKVKKWKVRKNAVEVRGPTGAYVFIRVYSEVPSDQAKRQFIAGGFTGLAESGKAAEKVAEEAVGEALDFLESDACIDSRLADQVLLPVLIAATELTFKTTEITQHLLTNTDVISKFLGRCVETEKSGRVKIRPPTRPPAGARRESKIDNRK